MPTDRMCQGCGIRRAEHVHHREFKGMGGRKSAEKQRSESLHNKIALCEVCHRASHGLVYYGTPTPAYPKGFHCGVCPKRLTCFYGVHLLGGSTEGMSPPW